MGFKQVLIVLCYAGFMGCGVQQNSALWEDYKNANNKGTEAILPNFSYVGYNYSESPIPTVPYKTFNVIDYGAVPNDNLSDKTAIIRAIQAASQHGEGVVYFPKGRYDINTSKDELDIIKIRHSKIVFRGEDRSHTILFFEKDLPPLDAKKLWTCPSAIQVKSLEPAKVLAKVVADATRETFKIVVNDASGIKQGDWVSLDVLNNSKDLIAYDIAPLVVDEAWTALIDKGVKVNEKHLVQHIYGDTIVFKEPIHYDVKAKHNWTLSSFKPLEHVGFENLTFEGNWTKKFIHHRSAQDDGGWTILNISKSVNSWIKDCTFKNVNRCASFSYSAACTALNVDIVGNLGHTAIHAMGSTGVLLANIHDKAGMHHSVGVAGKSCTNTVIWRCKYAKHTCFESHASQPRCTLFDSVEGGFFKGRGGGARFNLPNHGRYLVLWNFKETDDPEDNFRFVATDSWFWRIVPPIIVGFHGSGTTFKEDEVQILESLGTPVQPESLFEAQLKLRLGKLPKWIEDIKIK